ncbi:MAG TPA: acyl carrier protein [Geobacteraceae bacterium]|nr:acyl carrier protein [Geobacteraceae bacterium]
MTMINELKELMLKIGIDDCIVREVEPAQPIAGHVMDSADYPAFIVAIEERYGVKIADRYSLKLRSLNDFKNFINPEA